IFPEHRGGQAEQALIQVLVFPRLPFTAQMSLTALEGKRLPETHFRILSDVDYDLHLKLALPQGYEGNLHPLLLLVDAVPGSQAVTEEFALGWPQVLSSSHGVALAWVDGRSGVARGQKSPALDPRKLGSLTVKDQMGVVEWLTQLPYIDPRRIALYGKAFGGYLTLKMLAATDRLFKCAAVMAPITDFRLYSESALCSPPAPCA
ncbi:hypothetical protein JZ751_009312, partial [Albula glossodonta]